MAYVTNMPLRLEKLTRNDDEQVGEFRGIATMMEEPDPSGIVIQRGAFRKTLQESGGKTYLCDDHDEGKRVGVAYLRESGNQLLVERGLFNLATADGLRAYNEARFYADHEMPLGLSIGFGIPRGKTVQRVGRDGRPERVASEVKLFELSLVTSPAIPSSRVQAIRSGHGDTTDAGEPDLVSEIAESTADVARRYSLAAANDADARIARRVEQAIGEFAGVTGDTSGLLADMGRAKRADRVAEYLRDAEAALAERIRARQNDPGNVQDHRERMLAQVRIAATALRAESDRLTRATNPPDTILASVEKRLEAYRADLKREIEQIVSTLRPEAAAVRRIREPGAIAATRRSLGLQSAAMQAETLAEQLKRL